MRRLINLLLVLFVFSVVTPEYVYLEAQETVEESPENQKRGKNNVKLIKRKLAVFQRTLQLIMDKYVDDPDIDQILDGAIDGMLATLDPHSSYMKAEELSKFKEDLKDHIYGVGFLVNEKDGYPLVISPIEGTPAWEIGLRSGDMIIRVDGKSTKEESLDESIKRIKGPLGTEVTLTILRGQDVFDVTPKRAIIPKNSVPYFFMMDESDKIGYVRAVRFAERTALDVKDAIDSLALMGMEGLVLDLRGNPGGLMSQAVELAGLFFDKDKLMVYMEGRKTYRQDFNTLVNGDYTDLPVVVLIDRGSASASEIVSGAIQDWDRGVIVGTRSFGKGLVQNLFHIDRLEDGRMEDVKLTIAKYYTPSGRLIQREYKNKTAREYRYEAGKEDTLEERPVFHTLIKNRNVFGGGGISPDYEVKRDTTTLFERKLLIGRIFFDLAYDYSEKWEKYKEKYSTAEEFADNFKVNDEIRKLVEVVMEKKKIKYTEEELKDNMDLIEYYLKAEIMGRIYKQTDKYRFLLKDDNQLKKAIDLIPEAKEML